MSSSLPAWTAVAIPVAIASIAVTQLTDVLTPVADRILTLPVTQQVSLFALLFAVLFAATAVGSSSGSGHATLGGSRGFVSVATTDHNTSNVTGNVTASYPLAEIAAAATDREKFVALFPVLKQDILRHLSTENELVQESVDWVDDMMEYSVPGGKLNRGTTVINVYRTLLGGGGGGGTVELTPLQTARAAILGWAIEFLQAFFLVADDLMDDSETRRGQPCWYKVPKVKLIAINDSFLLESFVFYLLRRHFGNEPFYPDVLELMLDVTQKTEVGQLLDLTSQSNDGKIDLNRFTIERYRSIVKYKTAFYSFYLPVAMGMLLSGLRDPTAYATARTICCIMGEYFQIQDDYLDCFGDPEVIGKVGTDIQDNKCSWLVVQALAKCGAAQRAVLEKNYGQWDDKKVAKVKALYKELGLVELFEKYEEESYQQIQAELDKVTLMPRDVFELLLKKIYKRSK